MLFKTWQKGGATWLCQGMGLTHWGGGGVPMFSGQFQHCAATTKTTLSLVLAN